MQGSNQYPPYVVVSNNSPRAVAAEARQKALDSMATAENANDGLADRYIQASLAWSAIAANEEAVK